MLQHHPNGTLMHFARNVRVCLVIRHGSSLSRVGASDKPRAVQTFTIDRRLRLAATGQAMEVSETTHERRRTALALRRIGSRKGPPARLKADCGDRLSSFRGCYLGTYVAYLC